jgi:excisionase family DNA binding protein
MKSARDLATEELEELLRHDHYTPEELAILLGMDRHTIEQAAHRGELHATIFDHHILSIRREDVVRWLEGLR